MASKPAQQTRCRDGPATLGRPHVFLPADGTPTEPTAAGDSVRHAPDADLTGLPTMISNGDRDPIIPRTQTELLIGQLG